MFYSMQRSGGAPGGSCGLDNMSKAEILRGIVTEKLSTAAQEILAVVERTLAGYEEEASGFRQEIARQKRQLEVLQPRVKLERREMIPDLESHDRVLVSEREGRKEKTQQTDVEDTGSLGPMWFDDDDDVDEEEQPSMQQATSCRQKQGDLQDPDYQTPSRAFSPGVQSARRKPGRPRKSDTKTHLDLRICILENVQGNVLSNKMFRKCPFWELQCPFGLQESDFLNLLRSKFPQLTADKPFDIFTTDRSRRLQPLKFSTLTPEEIDRSIRATGAGRSALYIRLKTGEDPQTGSDDLGPPQRPDDADGDSPSSSASMTPDQSDLLTSLSPKDQSERRRPGRPRIGEEPTHHFLKICLLEDPQSDVLSKKVFMKSSIQELQCPRGLQEADFLDLLRSTFPQLAGDNKQFTMFKSDKSRRLQRLRVKTITPEEIYRSMRSTRTMAYIRLKTGEEDEEDEELNLITTNDATANDDADDDSSSAVAVVIKNNNSGPGSSRSVRPSSSTSQHMESDDEDVAESADKDGDEALDRDDDDWKPDPEQRLPKRTLIRRRGRPATVMERSKTPCKVCGVWYMVRGSLIKHAWSHMNEAQGVCGVCGERFESVEELKKHLRSYQQTHICTHCGKSFSTVSGLNCHTALHTGNQPFKCDVCGKAFARNSSLSIHRWIHAADKPYKCDVCPKAFGLKAQLNAHSKVHTGGDRYLCNICGKSVTNIRSLTLHKATHSAERRYGCEVCGKRFKILGTLREHVKIHTDRDRPYLCHICCKTFLTNGALKIHIKTHSNERPFICTVCNKGCKSNAQLKAHMRVHTDEAPYGCSECGRHFKKKSHLKSHIQSHRGIKRFVCKVCGKACSRPAHLTVHMRTHNGERPYKCSLCNKAFTQSHCLKTHMKSHQAEKNLFQDPSTS